MSSENAELRSLLDAYWAAEIAPADRGRLEDLLRQDPQARKMYRRYFRQHAFLLWTQRAAPPGVSQLVQRFRQIESPAAIERPVPQSIDSPILSFLGESLHWMSRGHVSPRLLAMTIAIALSSYFVGLLIMIGWEQAKVAQPQADGRHSEIAAGAGSTGRGPLSKPAVVARLTEAAGCVWDPADAPRPQSTVEAGQSMALVSGIVQFRFATGVNVAVEGPSAIRFESLERMLINSGRLVAQVPRGAEGFTVATPAADVVDLGTEFGVTVDEAGGTAVQVFVGKVELQNPHKSPQPGGGVVVSAGQARRVTRGSGSEAPVTQSIPPNASAFSNLVAPATKAKRLADTWAAHHERLSGDPRVVAYYDFEGGGATLSNRHGDGLHGKIKSPGKPPWTTGRRREKAGLALGDQFAHVIVPDAPQLRLENAVAVLVSFRLDAVPNTPALIVGKGAADGTRNYALWVTLDGARPRISWGVHGRDGYHSYVHGQGTIETGKWYTLVGVASQEGLALYVDGREEGRQPIVHVPLSTTQDDLRVGHSLEPPYSAHLTAVIDELAIFRESLTAEQIHQLIEPIESP